MRILGRRFAIVEIRGIWLSAMGWCIFSELTILQLGLKSLEFLLRVIGFLAGSVDGDRLEWLTRYGFWYSS